METVFVKVLNMGISASWLIVAVLVLRMLMKRAPRGTVLVLWGLVGLRLLLPVTIESSLSLVPDSRTIRPVTVEVLHPVVDSDVSTFDNPLHQPVAGAFAPNPVDSANPTQMWLSVVAILWMIGVLVVFAYGILSIVRLRMRVRESVPEGDHYICDYITGAFILGIIKPRIYLPSGMDEATTEHVLLHERAHIRHFDHLWKILAFVLLCVYWFHPLVWVSFILFCRDMEVACDERVIRMMETEKRTAYCEALVSCGLQRKVILAYPLAFGEIGVKERVKRILHYRKPAVWISVIAGLVCVIVTVCFLTDPKTESNAMEPEKAEEVKGDKDILNENVEVIYVFEDERVVGSQNIETQDFTPGSMPDHIKFPTVELPAGYTLGAYYSEVGYMGGFLILPKAYNVSDGEDGIPAEWMYSGMISAIPAQQTAVTYADGFPMLSGVPVHNHTTAEYLDVIGLERSTNQWPAIMLREQHDLYTHTQIENRKEDGAKLSDIELTSEYWYFWYVKEGEEIYYVLSLNTKDFSREEAERIAKTLIIPE